MSYDPSGVQLIVLDFETGVIPGAAAFLDPKKAPKSYKKDESKARYAEKAVEAELEDAALDLDLARIVAVAWKEPGMPAPLGMIAKTEEEERKVLRALTKRLKADDGGSKIIIGHGVLDFDVLLYQRRCLYLDVNPVKLSTDRYRHPRVIDTMQELSYNGRKRYRSVGFYRRRFGIKVEDQYTGADVSRLIVMGDWAGILAHCKADVETEYQIAVRCGFIDEPAQLDRQAAAPFFDDQPF